MRKTLFLLPAYVVFSFGSSLAGTSGAQDSVTVTQDLDAFCLAYTNHVPQGDVTFKPGVGLNGEAVPGPDLHPPLKVPSDDILIPITLDVANRLGLDLPPAVEGETLIGIINVKDGYPYFNDQPLNAGQNDALLQSCRDFEAR